jgi:N-sulfoglucosamine sulfohydrolase
MTNVAALESYADVRRELEQRLMDELKRTNDPRIVDDGKFFETPPMSGPAPETVQGKKNKKNARSP